MTGGASEFTFTLASIADDRAQHRRHHL